MSPVYDFSVLRQLRKREGLTIGRITSRAGVSGAAISKLERNKLSPGLDTLFRLGKVFGMTATDLLSLAENRTAQRAQASRHVSDDFTFDAVAFSNVRLFLGRADKGGTVSKPEIHLDDYEVCWVLRGKVLLSLPDEKYSLGQGEAVQFDAILEHTYCAIEDCEILIAHVRKGKRF
jgi:transcriptional regulator with XRE-family HTH domain